MKAQLVQITDKGVTYPVLKFVCPGCRLLTEGRSGLHMLPVNTNDTKPSWGWNGSLIAPTLTPSILTRTHGGVCHSFLTDGVFTYLEDSQHSLAGEMVPMVDLPEWTIKE